MGRSTVEGDLLVPGTLTCGDLAPKLLRSQLAQEALAEYPIPWTWWRVWDALGTNLPGTSAADDLGLYGGTWATHSPAIKTYDVKAAGAVALYARAQLILPPEYEAAETVVIRLHAGMQTTVASVSATADLVAYKSDDEAGIGSDLCATAAQSINSLVLADKDFTITATTLAPGDVLDVRLHLAINDAATATAVIGIVGKAALLCDIRG
jgi:hypothetical protein